GHSPISPRNSECPSPFSAHRFSSGAGLRAGLVWPLHGRRLKMDRSADRLSQSVQDIRAQRRRAFQEIAEQEHIESDFRGYLFQGPPAAMDGSAQVGAERVFGGGFIESLGRVLSARFHRGTILKDRVSEI